MVDRILPICNYHDEVEAYIALKNRYDHGKVS